MARFVMSREEPETRTGPGAPGPPGHAVRASMPSHGWSRIGSISAALDRRPCHGAHGAGLVLAWSAPHASSNACPALPPRIGARPRRAARENDSFRIVPSSPAVEITPPPVLSVRGLRVEFATRRGVLAAGDGVSFDIARGEVLGVVGESGAGKSVMGAAIVGLIDPPGRIAGGEIFLSERRIDNLSPEDLRRIRGRRIGFIVQDPLASLDPLDRIGGQIIETIRTCRGPRPESGQSNFW